MDTNFLLFHVWPYLALALFAFGLGLRCLFSAAAQSDQLKEMLRSLRGNRLFSLGLVSLAFAHGLGFVRPDVILLWNRAPLRLYLLETAGFAIGIVALCGWAMAVWRHLRRPEASVVHLIGDSMFLALLGVALASGLATATLYRWSSSWGAAIVSPYVASLAEGKPLVGLLIELPLMSRLHVVAAFGALALLPATRLAALIDFGISRAWVWALVPVARGLRPARAWLARHDPTAWIWRDDTEPEVLFVPDPPDAPTLLYPAGSSTSSSR